MFILHGMQCYHLQLSLQILALTGRLGISTNLVFTQLKMRSGSVRGKELPGMNIVWSRFLRSPYRREPVASLIVTAGVVEAAIGGLDEHWSLLAFGLGTVGVAMALRWWQQRQPIARTGSWQTKQRALYALPPASSRPKLPVLTLSQRKPTDRKR